jgi:outer membrane receptor protein involved in Fe transport
VLGVLVLAALALITASFRESSDGPLHGAQGAVAGALQPLEVGVERVARPFRDAYGWTEDLFNARSDNDELKAENELLRQQVIQNESALQQNVQLKRLLEYREGPSFPNDYDGVAAQVIARPASAFEQEIVVTAGSDDGVRLNAAVVTADGFVGTVTGVGPLVGTQMNAKAIPAYDYFDLTARFAVSDELTITMGVQNLFDKDAPNVGNTIGSTTYNSGNTYPSTYDVLGRRYAVSARLRF